MVPIKTHSAIVQACTQEPDETGVIRDPQLGAASTPILCYAEPMNSGDAQMEFGVVLKQPWFLMCELADEPTFTPSAIVQLTPSSGGATLWFQVVSWPGRSEAGNAADHAEVLLRRLQYPPTP